MGFNVNVYEKLVFHEDELSNKRIKSLLLLFQYETSKRNMSIETQIMLIDKWLESLIDEEFYEVIPFFEGVKEYMILNKDKIDYDISAYINRNIIRKSDKKSFSFKKVSFLYYLKYKIIELYNKMFKR